ncbi:hypothetical protein [Flavobacterium sp.]|uniref:hypothetical protein n=1 Tax=Flavobacterium sp. TaxID=239 RepID=UPI0037516561
MSASSQNHKIGLPENSISEIQKCIDIHYKIYYYLEKASKLELEAIKSNIAGNISSAGKFSLKASENIEMALNLQKELKLYS